MTISNDSPIRKMNMKISTDAGISKQMIQSATLGAVFQVIFGLFSSVGGFLKLDIVSWQNFVLLVTPIVVFVLGLAGLVLLRRGKPLQGSSLVFITNLLLPIVAVLLQTGLGWAVFVYALTSSIMLIWQVMPKVTRSWTVTLAALSLALIAAMEWFNPSTRVAAGEELSTFFYSAGAILVIIFLVQAGRQAWGGSLRTKILTSFLLSIILAVAAISLFSFYSANQSQTFMFDQLETAVRTQSETQLSSTTQTETQNAEETFSEIVEEVGKLAEYQATLYTQSPTLGQGTYWDANTQLTIRSGGQYGNSQSDPASVVVPSTVTLDEAMISEINTNIYLNFTVPTILASNPDIVAIYSISTSGVSIYYPNINLSEVTPPDFDPRVQSFYRVATPQNNPERKVVWTEPYQDPAGQGLLVTSVAPVYDQTGRFKGVVAADVRLIDISNAISAVKIGQSGFAFLIDPAGHVIGMPVTGYKLFNLSVELVPFNETPKQTILGMGPIELQAVTRKMTTGETGLETITIQDEQFYVSYAPLPSVGYSLGVVAPVAELDAPYLTARDQVENETQDSNRLFLIILVFIVLGASGSSLLFSQFLSGPIVRLTKVAEQVTAGDLGAQAKVESADETGALANAFNRMTAQLREFIGTLESRVADRTRNLELAAEVGRTVSQVRALDIMLTDAAELIRKQFDLYYVQVYLTDLSRENLNLQAGTGQVGAQLLARRHRLTINIASINGRAALERKSVVISDTTASATFKPNPLLPDTRSEMAVPLLIGDRVVGVLDMQSERPDAFNQEILPAFEALAGQMAIAIQNASLLAEAEEARREVELQAQRLSRSNWVEYLDAIHKPEESGFIFEQNKIAPLAQSNGPLTKGALVAPITVTGEMLGNLVVEMEGRSSIARVEELVNTVARQVAQQIENLRLLDNAERYRAEAEEASRRITREGWKDYVQANVNESLSYYYDLREVRPHHSDGDQPSEASTVTLPLKVRDEAVGSLSIIGIAPDDTASLELANAVAERLSAHIESLRQYGQTQQALATTQRLAEREQALRQITSVVRGSTDPATILRSAARELGNLLGRKTIIRLETAREAQGSQTDHPAGLVEEATANDGNKPVSPADQS
jgi:GAF domain-containing protein/HAMP domain-containing protein